MLDVDRDLEGRCIMVTVKLEDQEYLLVNLYAPNSDTPGYFNDVIQRIVNKNPVQVIIGGHFNLVLDEQVDSLNRKTNNVRSKAVIIEFMEDFGLEDVWRTFHGDEWVYTCFKRKPTVAGQFDFLMLSQGLMGTVESCQIEYATFSDHSLVMANMDIELVKHGPGIWRLNCHLLDDAKIVDEAKSLIELKKRQNAHLPIQESWELIKSNLAIYFQDVGRKTACANSVKLGALNNIIQELHAESVEDPLGETKYLNEVKAKIDYLENKQIEGVIFRSRARWVEEGERSSKYFFSLEKRNYNAKLMRKINMGGKVCTEQKEILKAQRDFYKALYTQDGDKPFMIENNTQCRLSEEQKERLEANITIEEMLKALQDMKPGKAPGKDRLPMEFYKTFWNKIASLLYDVYCDCMLQCKLNKTARVGLISLLPKGKKDPNFLKNWRPLTLLNLDYKILAKVLALRLKLVVPDLIGPQQTGFMEGRQISKDIRKTMDVITYMNIKKKACLIMTIDFEKCFGLLTYNAIQGALTYFHFGKTYNSWIALFFNEFTVQTYNAGYLSYPFVKTRSINQGCPISPYLFLLCSEIMSHKLSNHHRIEGVTVGEAILLLSQFVDDADHTNFTL